MLTRRFAFTVIFSAAVQPVFGQQSTRFMRLSSETVGGRRVTDTAGDLYLFHRDGRFTFRRGGIVQSGRWSLSHDKVVSIDFADGRSTTLTVALIDGEHHIRMTEFGRRHTHNRVRRIVKIEPE